MSCTCNRSEVDLSKLEYIHVGAVEHTVCIRNLMVCFEKQGDMHPTFYKDFKVDSSAPSADKAHNVHGKDNQRGDSMHRKIHHQMQLMMKHQKLQVCFTKLRISFWK
jgi:hypothetical protein